MFRGLRNLDATIEHAAAHYGMKGAKQVVLSGGSAGGLATFLHADRVGRVLGSVGASVTTLRALPQLGYFLDHTDINGTDAFGAGMAHAFHMQNLTSAPSG
jgi:hypothetical protein